MVLWVILGVSTRPRRQSTIHHAQLTFCPECFAATMKDESNSDNWRVTRSSVFRIGMGMIGIVSLFLALANHYCLGTAPVDSSSFHRRLALRNDYKTVVARVPQPLKVIEMPTTSNRLVMMSAVFGTNPLPPYFPMFLRSIQASGADGIIIGGNEADFYGILPPNVKHIPMTWDGLHDLISDKLFDGTPLPGFQAASPYKVNDVKPMFGFLFREYIREYEFWAHVDNDLIFGDVAGILNPLMDDFDVISPHGNKRKTFGPLTAYRNVPEIIELFRLIDGDLYDALNNSNTIAIDEWGQLGQDTKTLSMTHVISNHNEVHVSPGFLPLIGWDRPKKIDCVWKVKDGRATLTKLPNDEVIMCHFMYSKRTTAEILSKTDQYAILQADTVMWSAKNGLSSLNDKSSAN